MQTRGDQAGSCYHACSTLIAPRPPKVPKEVPHRNPQRLVAPRRHGVERWAVIDFNAARDRRGVTQRQFVRQTGVPRSTLQDWITRGQHTGLAPEVVAFFECPAGVLFLNRLFQALLFVLTLVSPSGLRHVAMVLRLSGLDRWLASSHGALHAASVRMDQGVTQVGEAELTQLAAAMPLRKIALCEDETHHPKPCLVAIEPVSDFILVEEYAEQRDATTWNEAVARATAGLRVEVEQVTSDLARGIRLHAQQGLGARHHADIFHVQYDASRATGAAMASNVRHAVKELETTQRALENVRAHTVRNPHGLEDPVVCATQIAQAERDVHEAQEVLEETQRQRASMQQEVRQIRASYHPFDLMTGVQRSSHTVGNELRATFVRMKDHARLAGLSKAQDALIAKAARVIPLLVATMAWVHHRILARVLELSLPSAERTALLTELIPGLYLLRVCRAHAGRQGSCGSSATGPILGDQRSPGCLAISARPAPGKGRTDRPGVRRSVRGIEFLRGGTKRPPPLVPSPLAPTPHPQAQGPDRCA